MSQRTEKKEVGTNNQWSFLANQHALVTAPSMFIYNLYSLF